MHLFQRNLSFLWTSIVVICILAVAFGSAHPVENLEKHERTTLSKRSLDDFDEDGVAIFAKGEGENRKFIWSKFSAARNYFGAGDAAKEVESMTLNS